MEIRLLRGVPVPQILEVFNSAFSDYTIPMKLDLETFEWKVMVEGIDYASSAGAFKDGRLVGFILHGLDEFNGHKRVFNAATGVIPFERGQRLVDKMYSYILPVLKSKGYTHHQLEVLDGNIKAEKAYITTGFSHSRDVVGYKGAINTKLNNKDITITEVENLDWSLAQSFWDVQPAYQNHTNTVIRGMKRQKIVTALVNEFLAGYAVYDIKNNRIKQFAVNPNFRRKGVGTALFAYISYMAGEVHFINYDDNDKGAQAFFSAIGLQPAYRLHEMTLVYS